MPGCVSSCASNSLTIAFIGIPPVAASREDRSAHALRFWSRGLWHGEHDRHDGRDDHQQVERQCNQSRLADRHVVLPPGKGDHAAQPLTSTSSLALSAVKIAAEIATPNDAPSDDAIL